jgi:two-component system, NarL family, response regulator DegU
MLTTLITVLVVDDHALVRSAISQVLISQPQVERIVLAQNYAEAEKQTAHLCPEIIWLDLHIARSDSSAEIGRLRELSPASHIMALADVEDEQEAFAAIMAGAQGYRSKQDLDLDEIMTMIQMLCCDEFVLRPALLARLLQRLRAQALPLWGSEKRAGRHPFVWAAASTELAQLTRREREVLQSIRQGYRDREIARGLHITEKTVQKHVQNILSKLGVQNRTEAAYLLHSQSLS